MSTGIQWTHDTGIQWTHVPGYIGATWNPTTGCTRVSPGCDHCYAFELHDQRFRSNRQVARAFYDTVTDRPESFPTPVEMVAWARGHGAPLPFPPQYDLPFSAVQVLGEDRLTAPLRKRKPHAYFVDSMADLFHEDVPDEAIDRVFAVMALAPHHLFMILTKRPERMREYLSYADRDEAIGWAAHGMWEDTGGAYEVANALIHPGIHGSKSVWPLPNVWLGFSAENQAAFDERAPLAVATPAAKHFVSLEPLLGPVEFSNVGGRSDAVQQLGRPALAGIDWAIVGGESGRHARPFDLAWARSVVEQCRAAGVAAFVKQLGSRPVETVAEEFPSPGRYTREATIRLKHNHGGNPAEWPEDLRVRQFPFEAVR